MLNNVGFFQCYRLDFNRQRIKCWKSELWANVNFSGEGDLLAISDLGDVNFGLSNWAKLIFNHEFVIRLGNGVVYGFL